LEIRHGYLTASPKKRPGRGAGVANKITRADGSSEDITLLCRIDTLDEVDYYLHGGILQYVLRRMMKEAG